MVEKNGYKHSNMLEVAFGWCNFAVFQWFLKLVLYGGVSGFMACLRVFSMKNAGMDVNGCRPFSPQRFHEETSKGKKTLAKGSQ